jgi:short-subunit dehydrogenase
MNKTLIIISGSTKGLGSSLHQVFAVKYEVICLNRTKNSENTIMIDLNDRIIDLNQLEKKIDSFERVIFISNASIIEPIKNINAIDDTDIENSIYINYINPSKIVIHILKSAKTFGILHITSGAAFTANTKLALYSASKAAMHRFIEILKVEESNNSRMLFVENFDPGRMQTPMQSNLIASNGLSNNISDFKKPEEVAEQIYQFVGKYL